MKTIGVTNEVVCLDDPKAAFVGSDFFPVHAIGPRKSPWAYSSALIPWLQENIHRFDAVIVHGLWLYHSFAARKFIKALDSVQDERPLWFVMPHGMLDPYFQEAPDRRLKAWRNILYWKLIESKVIEAADAVLFTCEEEKNLAEIPFKPYRPKRAIDVGYGIKAPPSFTDEMSKAFNSSLSHAGKSPYLLFLSRIHPKKGLDNLIDAYKLLLEDSADLPMLVIAGPDSDSAYGKRLRAYVSKNELLRNRVFFPGMLSGDAKWGAFYGCEAFVLPSHQENFGIAVAEALACGKPVLISDKVNIWREIELGNGGIVTPDTFDGAAHMLRQWLALSENERISLGRNAMSTFIDNFSVEKHVDRLIPILSGNFGKG